VALSSKRDKLDTQIFVDLKSKFAQPSKNGLTLLEVCPSEDSKIKEWISAACKTEDRHLLRQINMVFGLSIPEFVWFELLEMMSSGTIYQGRLTLLSKREEHFEVQSFRAAPVGRFSIPSDRLPGEGEAHLLIEKFREASIQLAEDLKSLSVCREQISIFLPKTRKVEAMWSLSLDEILKVLRLASNETALWEVRELAVNLRELVREKVPGFGMIYALS
jgi:hypothetical protein